MSFAKHIEIDDRWIKIDGHEVVAIEPVKVEVVLPENLPVVILRIPAERVTSILSGSKVELHADWLS